MVAALQGVDANRSPTITSRTLPARIFVGAWAGGEALQPNAVTVYWKNGKVATTDGPFAETREQIGGILVLEARDMNHAVQLMSRHPAVKYGSIFDIRAVADLTELMKASEERRKK